MPTDPLDPLLAAAESDPGHLGPDELAAIAQRLSQASPEEFILAAARAPGLEWDDGQGPGDYFQIHDRDWWVDTHHAGNRRHLGLLAVAAALVDALRLDMTLDWTAKVLPALVTVESTVIDAFGVHLTLRRLPDPTLPAELVEEVHPLDFADLAATLAAASATVALPAGGTVTFAA